MTEYIKDEVINEIFNRTKSIIENTDEYTFTAKVMRLSFIMNTVYERILKHSEEPISGGISGYSKQQLDVMKNWNFKINNGKIKKFPDHGGTIITDGSNASRDFRFDLMLEGEIKINRFHITKSKSQLFKKYNLFEFDVCPSS